MRLLASAASRVLHVYPPQIFSCGNYKKIFSTSTRFLYPMEEGVTNVVYKTLSRSSHSPSFVHKYIDIFSYALWKLVVTSMILWPNIHASYYYYYRQIHNFSFRPIESTNFLTHYHCRHPNSFAVRMTDHNP